MRKFVASLAIVACLGVIPSAALADLDPHDPNYQICQRIVQNCSKIGYGGYSSFQECWEDQGAPNCPDQQPQPWGTPDYGGDPWWAETYWYW